jgi:transcriptional regulator, fis family
MIKTNEIVGLMAKHQISRKEMAKRLGITPKTFSLKLKKGHFGSDEIETMIEELKIEDPMSIFFAKKVAL